ncbi:hypothetical protein ABZW30_42115, partial [Kitasatospora sp. NPDC004669]|uniref:hypothetical protein n=1 Tax=Kitasatospora sp. NPDC004669 TaxID=3154555 RepID=UPI0033A027EF
MSGVLLGGGGTALASTVPTTLHAVSAAPNIHRYVAQDDNPRGRDAGYKVGLDLGAKQAISDYKHGQTSRSYAPLTVSGNDPNYSYLSGVLKGEKDGYSQEMNTILGEKTGPMIPTPWAPYGLGHIPEESQSTISRTPSTPQHDHGSCSACNS